jgi:hypothetical protein
MLEDAGIEGYEMKQRILFSFQMIRSAIMDIDRQKAEERARRK